MKLCIPTMEKGGLDDEVSIHFGRAPTFTVVDTESKEVAVVKNRSEHMGGLGKPPEHIARTGAKVMICSGLGPRAIEMLNSFGIEVYIGATGTAGEALKMWEEGKLPPATYETACKEHFH